eukprot:6613925-Pyramimonas_sp.AAC.1
MPWNSQGSKVDEPKVERITMWQQLEKIGELMEHYFFKLPAHIGVPKLLDKAAELQRWVIGP